MKAFICVEGEVVEAQSHFSQGVAVTTPLL